MNSAYTDNQAASKAGRIAHLALRGALACALVFGAGAAFSQQYGGDRGDRGGEHRDDAPQHPSRERFSLPQDRGGRDAGPRGYDDQRRAQQPYQQGYPQAQAQPQPQPRASQYDQAQSDDARRGSGRLTPDERRDLRRQINEAGIDLYQRKR